MVMGNIALVEELQPTTRQSLVQDNDDLWDIIMRHVKANRRLRTMLYVSLGFNLWLAGHYILNGYP